MRLMIVDDEDIIRRGLSTVIDWTEIGLTLLPPAASADEALERIPEEKPHVLFTDIRMPGMDGIELAGRVRELLPGTETVILTGYDDFGYAREALREGVSDYLLKTSRPEEIIRAAAKAKQRVLERWEARRQESLQTAALRHQLIERLLAQGPGTASESPLPAALQSWFRRSGLCGPKGSRSAAGPARAGRGLGRRAVRGSAAGRSGEHPLRAAALRYAPQGGPRRRDPSRRWRSRRRGPGLGPRFGAGAPR
ncbi:response regulator [Paenibacillus mucilaginosus]|uniref:response regulator n=1 Tax=Paenibacillus mucilaginosus TaxID=61624 RepID=UPI00240D1419|nr:response regulator [Paenibacillus mucilaginosus]